MPDRIKRAALANDLADHLGVDAGLVLEEGTTTSLLWQDHQKLALDVADDIIDLQEYITGKTFSRSVFFCNSHCYLIIIYGHHVVCSKN